MYKSVTSGVLQLGLPEKRVSPTVTVQSMRGDKVNNAIDTIMGVAERRIEGTQMSASTWTFHAFVSASMRASTNVALNSGLVNNKIGGTGHGESLFVLSEAVYDGATADDEEDEEDDGQLLDFIDDRDTEQGDERGMYRELDADEARGRDDVIVTPTAKTARDFPITDYLIPEDEVLDVISGEDSDHGDREPHEKTWEEACDILGVTLSPDTATRLNGLIDRVMLVSNVADGSCTYRAILNGLFMHHTILSA